MSQPKPTGPMSDEELATALTADIEDACTYADTELGPLRAAAIHYYHARKFGDEEQGRSQVVMPVVRDTIRATLPSLMKKFFGSRKVVRFSPGSTKGGQFADDATATVNYVFTVQNPGYNILWDAFKDGLRCKTGWLKWWWDESVVVGAKEYSGVTDEQLEAAHATLHPGESLDILSKTQVGTQQTMQMVPLAHFQQMQAAQQQPQSGPDQQQPQMAVPNAAPPGAPGGSPQVQMTPQGPAVAVPQQVPVFSYTIRITSKKPLNKVRIASVPPDEIIFPRDTWDLDNCRLIAHRTRKTRGELVAMGVHPDDLESIPTDDVDQLTNIEFLARQTIPSSVMTQAQSATWDQERVPYYECFYRVDQDGDGISELRKICRIGRSGKIVSNKIWDEVPLALLCPDPEPHVIVGNSQADFIMDVQNISSHVWRDLLDSLKQSIFPRMAYVEGQANLDDVMNSEIGAAIRMRAPGMVQPLTVPFTGQQAFPLLEQLDQVREQRTGVGNAAMALDGSALQSTTPVAAQATVAASQAQVELTARMFANGVARMFRGVLRLLCEHQNQQMEFELNGRAFNVAPNQWDPDLNVIVDTALGQGQNVSEQLEVLDGVATAQKELLQQYGPDNPLCGLQEYYNTITAMMELGGFRDTQRYWRDPSVSQQQGKQLQPPPPSPEAIQAQANQQIESMKVDKDRLKIILDDEFRRDQLRADVQVRLAEIHAKYGAHFDGKVLDAQLERERMESQETIAQMRQPPASPAGG